MAAVSQAIGRLTKLSVTWFESTGSLLADWSRSGIRRRRRSLWDYSAVSAERLEMRALCTQPPVGFVSAFNAGVGLYSDQTAAAEAAYDSAIAGEFDQLWLDAATAAGNAAADVDPSGADWSDISGDIDPAESSALSGMLAAIPTDLDTIKTTIAADLPNLTLPSSLRIPTNLEWTQVDDDTWDVNGSELSTSPFVQIGVTWSNSQSNYVQVRARRTPSNDFDLTGRIQNWNYRLSPQNAYDGDGETFLIYDLNTRVTLSGLTPSATGQLNLDYHRRDKNATGENSLLTELKLRDVDITSGIPQEMTAVFGVRNNNDALAFRVTHSPVLGSTKAVGSIWREGDNYGIEIGGGTDTQSPEQTFWGARIDLKLANGGANGLFSFGIDKDFYSDTLKFSTQYASPNTLLKLAVDKVGIGPYGNQDQISASVIRRIPASPAFPLDRFFQLGFQKNRNDGTSDIQRQTFLNQPNLSWQYLSRGLTTPPEPSIQGPFVRCFVACPIDLSTNFPGLGKRITLTPSVLYIFNDGQLQATVFFSTSN